MYRLAAMHSIAERQTDTQQYHANSWSYSVKYN